MTVPIKPLSDRVVAVREEVQTKTASGLYLPDQAQEKPLIAAVVAIGPGVTSLKVDDKILYKDYSGSQVRVNETEYLIIREEDVLATLEK